MNCTQAQDQLPGLLYGDLRSEDKAALEEHLAGCSTCRREYAALSGVRKLLDRVPAPDIRLDLAALYRQAADRQARRVRFWRSTAIASCGAAAALVAIALLLRMEFRLESHQLVLRWGSGSAGATETPFPEKLVQARPASPQTEEQLRLLSQLIHALADTVETRDLRQQQEFIQLRAELADLQRRTAQWRRDTERDVGALYTAQLISLKKGDKP